MDIVFIVPPCSRLGRAGSLSRAGRGSQALQVLAGEVSTAQPGLTHLWARVRLQRRARRGEGAMERGGLWRRGKREREATERELSLLGDFQSVWLHPEGSFWELRGCWAGPCGRGHARAGASAQVCPRARAGSEGSCLHPARSPPAQGKEKSTSLRRYISDTMGCYFTTVQKALKSLCAAEQ